MDSNIIHQICAISISSWDLLKLINVPQELNKFIREGIEKGWPKGIQKEGVSYGAYEMKLRGHPWVGASEEAVYSRKLLNNILIIMAQNGWNLIQSADVSKKEQSNDTMFFENAEPDPDVQMFAISFNLTDRIRIIDAPEMVSTIVKDAINSHWSNGIQREKEYYGSQEFKLRGVPWHSMGSDGVQAKFLLVHLLSNLRKYGYKLYGSVDISRGSEGQDLESWVFRKVNPVWK